MVCSTCNSKWRDLATNSNNSQITGNSSAKYPDPPVDLLQLPVKNQSFTPMIPESFTSHQPGAKTSSGSIGLILSVVGMVIFLVSLIVYQYYPLSQSNQLAKNMPARLTLGDVNIENIENSNFPVWVISARISNHSAHSLPVPPVLMYSGTKGSSGYFGWTVKPALQKLAPGSNLIIRTSVQKPVGSSQKIELEFVSDNLKTG